MNYELIKLKEKRILGDETEICEGIQSSSKGQVNNVIWKLLLIVMGILKNEMSMISNGFSSHTLSILFPVNWNLLPHTK